MNSTSFTLHFSGHETFALRYGWLNKAYTTLNLNEKNIEKQVVELGVGKNMVNSIKYWSDISGLVPLQNKEDKKLSYETKLGDIFEKFDPYLELNESTWLLHYFIQKRFNDLTFSRWYFNFSNKQIFDKSELVSDLIDWLESTDLKVPSLATLQKDFDCFLLCYSKRLSGKKLNEDTFISPLNELNLIYQIESHKFKADLLEQKNLPVQVFLYCLVDYWKENLIESPTISVDSVSTNPGSPGRLYRLNNAAVDYFLNQCALIDDRFKWTDTLGMRSLACDQIKEINLEELLSNIYRGKIENE
ncbi:DUF4007 family protein [Acinetobacter sp. ME22]|uniref:DUF4007 family protein n=1 Tax=Acinetobacter sp. ME22 TaxID=2904802 RepID=UPI001EDAD255|nr:DUF4007 family protein [Acinetobacter sp. ME22]MCG2573462.1 DUF4007 family protein [Acinetobacter sp. ME22]